MSYGSLSTHEETMSLLNDAQDMTHESHMLGTNISSTLETQGEILQNAQNKTKETSKFAQQSKEALNALQWKIYKEKICLWFWIFALAVSICITLYYLIKNGGKL